MFFGIVDLTTYILGTIFIILIPGPNSIYVMTTSSRQGVHAGIASAAGVFVGDSILMLLASLGAAAVLHTLPSVFLGIQVVGAIYLMWLGYGLLTQAKLNWTSRHQAYDAPKVTIDKRHPFKRALLISLVNPKAILFFVSFFVQFVSPEYEYPWLSFLILAIILQVFSVAYLATLIWGGVSLANLFARRRGLSAIGNALVGIAFISFGLKMLVEIY